MPKTKSLSQMFYVVSAIFSECEHNVKSRSRLLYAVAHPSVCHLSSVTFMQPTQPVEILGNVSTPFGTLAIR